ncbi:MAG: hypothetical protein RLZZ324_541 [Candidatus Parcubacteria bacterium]|jgi:gas vesicle protein
MGAKKTIVKGLAAGAVLGAVAMLLSSMKKDGRLDTKQLGKTADRIKGKVAKHAMTIGKLTKSAYDSIVETTVAEYRGVKALSDGELSDLKDELKSGWMDVKKMVMKKPAAKGKKR